jgi:hypothetical protein
MNSNFLIGIGLKIFMWMDERGFVAVVVVIAVVLIATDQLCVPFFLECNSTSFGGGGCIIL